MISQHHKTAFQGSVYRIQTKYIVTPWMYFAADCCSQTDTAPVMFTVRHLPTQHAAQLKSGLISNFLNTQPHFKNSTDSQKPTTQLLS